MPATRPGAPPDQDTAASALFSPFALGSLSLPNRIVMAPLTRARADRAGVPVRSLPSTTRSGRARD